MGDHQLDLVRRWTAKKKTSLFLSILKGKTSEAGVIGYLDPSDLYDASDGMI